MTAHSGGVAVSGLAPPSKACSKQKGGRRGLFKETEPETHIWSSSVAHKETTIVVPFYDGGLG